MNAGEPLVKIRFDARQNNAIKSWFTVVFSTNLKSRKCIMSASALSLPATPNHSSFKYADQPPLSSFRSIGRGTGKVYIAQDSFGDCMSFLTIEELARACLISKSWRSFIDSPNGQFLWKNVSLREGVPVVEGQDRNYKDEFRFLRPITIGGKAIARYLGEIVGEVPRMRQDHFLELRSSQDSFEPAKFRRDTHVVLVDPAVVKITVSPNRPLALDESGTLVEVLGAKRAMIAPKELTVPFSFNNLKALAKYPLAGIKNGPVFDSSSEAEVFNQCNAPSDQNRVLIMRKEVVARNTPFTGDHGQKAQVINQRCEVMTVRLRAFYNAIMILKNGTCPDSQNPLTYVRSAEHVSFGTTTYKAGIGGFVPGVGVRVYSYLLEHPLCHVGIVPVSPAEILRLQSG